MSTLGWVLLGITLAAIAWAVWYACRIQRRFRKKRKDRVSSVNAGDRKECVGATVATDVLRTHTFTDKNGSVIDPADFNKYIVIGNSMQYCGINDRDLIFATKGVNVKDLEELPKPMIIKWENAPADAPQFKLRRGWATWIPCDDADGILEAIFANPAFEQVRRIPGYDGDEKLADNFKNIKLPEYLAEHGIQAGKCSIEDRVLISITWHVDERQVRFSIHRLSNLVGVVKASFDVEN